MIHERVVLSLCSQKGSVNNIGTNRHGCLDMLNAFELSREEPAMDVQDLRCLVTLAEERHFGRTAARLHVSTAQVSQRIKKLESSVGGKLFYRSTRDARLTELGSELLQGARRLLEMHESLAQRIRDRASGRTGTIRLALNVSATYSVLPLMLGVLADRRPGVNVAVVNAQGFTALLEEALLEARVDLIVARAPVKSEELDSLSLFREPMAVLMPHGHRLAGRTRIELPELDGEHLVSFPLESASAVATWVDQVLRQAGVHMHRQAEAEETTGLLGLVAAGLGVAIAPQSVSVLHPGLDCVQISGMPVTDMVLGWHRETEDRLTLSVVSLMRETQSLFRSLGSGTS